jgi:hypothetical protein
MTVVTTTILALFFSLNALLETMVDPNLKSYERSVCHEDEYAKAGSTFTRPLELWNPVVKKRRKATSSEDNNVIEMSFEIQTTRARWSRFRIRRSTRSFLLHRVSLARFYSVIRHKKHEPRRRKKEARTDKYPAAIPTCVLLQ